MRLGAGTPRWASLRSADPAALRASPPKSRRLGRYRLIDYEAAKEAQERAQKEWPLVGAYGVDPNYKGKGLQLEFTVEDEGAFTMPWKATVTYRRAGHEDWQERVCAENIEHYYTGVQYYSDKDARIPTAEKPDF